MSLSPGQAFGNYRILSRIAVGGMGMVFLAEHPHIGKRVALKIIHRDLAGNREVVNRFLNEARAVNHIGSEHIVQIHDFGQTDDGEHFFIMEYLDGRTLAQELAAWRVLEVPRALHIAGQIAGALAVAHDANIIHRDLKPDNVMLIERLGDPDFVKLLDFGLAKFLIQTEARKLTAAGVLLGTPQYMSPEACESRTDVDGRSDIYSLGVLMFQMVTGQLPFTGESMGEVLIKQVTQAPPVPRGINPQVPPAVEQVVLRCLAKNPAQRFQTMRELRDALFDPAGHLVGSPPAMPVTAMPDAPTLYRPDRAADQTTELASTEFAIDRSTSPGPSSSPAKVPAPGPVPGLAPRSPGGRTAYMDEAAHRRFAGRNERRPLARPVPERVQNRTIEIGTPHGYSAHLPRPRWPLVIAILLAGAASVMVLLREHLDRQGPGSPWSGQRTLAGASEREAGRGAGAGAASHAGPAVARIRLNTRPSGAEVSDGAGTHIGVTPIEIELPIDGREVVLRFRHPEATDSEKRFTPTGDTAFDIALPPAPIPPPEAAADAGQASGPDQPAASRPVRHPHEKQRVRRRPKRPTKPSSDLLRPEF